MVTLGTAETRVLGDDWTVVTTDGSRAAHWENSVAVTDDGIWVLTALDGGQSRPGAAGGIRTAGLTAGAAGRPDGAMLWLCRKTLSGSQARFSSASRA